MRHQTYQSDDTAFSLSHEAFNKGTDNENNMFLCTFQLFPVASHRWTTYIYIYIYKGDHVKSTCVWLPLSSYLVFANEANPADQGKISYWNCIKYPEVIICLVRAADFLMAFR